MNFFAPVITLSGLGVIFGVGLALAARKFSVAVERHLEEIYAKLPGINCGSCGTAGCLAFAEGLLKGTRTLQACPVMAEKARAEVAGILGVVPPEKIKRVALLHCHGGSKRAKDKGRYAGIRDCFAANLILGGPKLCDYACLGFASCVRACPFGAISMNDDELPVVDEDRCTACGKCVAACPKKLFSLVPVDKGYAIRCKSLDSGKKVMLSCSIGCIACGRCVEACPSKAIRITDNLAMIDYNLCLNKGECFQVCPTKAIAAKQEGRWVSRR